MNKIKLYNEAQLSEVSGKMHNLLYALRCLQDCFIVFNSELNYLAKKHLNPKRYTKITSVIREYNNAEKSMEYAKTYTREIYKDDEMLDSTCEDSCNVLSPIITTALNMDYSGNDNHEKCVILLPKDLLPKFKTWMQRYHRDVDFEYLGITEEETNTK